MPIQVASQLIPRGANNPDPSLVNTWYVLEDVYLKGGFQVWPTVADRDAINSENLKSGMLVLTQDVRTLWILEDDLVTWTAFVTSNSDGTGNTGGGGSGGGSGGTTLARQTVIQNCGTLAAGANTQFTLQLGMTAMVLMLTVTEPVLVQAYSTAAMTDANPYTFLATPDHLSDDGTMLLSDGSTINLRRYAVLANLESPPTKNSYFVVTNPGTTSVSVALTITFLPLEGFN